MTYAKCVKNVSEQKCEKIIKEEQSFNLDQNIVKENVFRKYCQ